MFRVHCLKSPKLFCVQVSSLLVSPHSSWRVLTVWRRREDTCFIGTASISKLSRKT